MEMLGDDNFKKSSKKPKRNHPKKSPRSFESIKATIEKKKQCNSKVLEIVTNLSDQTVDENSLLKIVPYINQEHYQDIVEERAINKLCGYALCPKNLTNIPKKQYHISTGHNKVFDITERKNFCSNLCYKASKYIKDQILTTPVWLRENESSSVYKLLPLHSKGGDCGDEVDLGITYAKPDVDESPHDGRVAKPTSPSPQDSIDSIYETCKGNVSLELNSEACSKTLGEGCIHLKNELEQMVDDCMKIAESSKGKNVLLEEKLGDCAESIKLSKDIIISSSNVREHSEQKCVSSESFEESTQRHSSRNSDHSEKENLSQGAMTNHTIQQSDCTNGVSLNMVQSLKSPVKSCNLDSGTVTKDMSTKCKDSSKSKRPKSSLKKHSKTGDPTLLLKNLVIKTETVLKEWFTLNTLCFLLGEEKVKELLKVKEGYIKDLNIMPTSLVGSQYYEQYLAICKKLNILEIEDMKTDSSFREKVKNPLPDYNALKEEAKELELKVKMFYKGDKVQFDTNNVDKKDTTNESPSFDPILPSVDLHAQKALRRKIVSDRLFKAMQDVEKTLGLNGLNITENIRIMLNTFLLSAHNITLKPVEWNLVCIFLIKLLSIKDTAVNEALNSSLARNHLTLILMSYSLDSGYLDRLVVWLTDVECIIQKNNL